RCGLLLSCSCAGPTFVSARRFCCARSDYNASAGHGCGGPKTQVSAIPLRTRDAQFGRRLGNALPGKCFRDHWFRSVRIPMRDFREAANRPATVPLVSEEEATGKV